MSDPFDLSRLPDVTFAAPERAWFGLFLLLVLVLAPLARGRLRAFALPLFLRAGALLALLAVLSEPVVSEHETRTGRLLVCADVSPSVGTPGLRRTESLLERARAPFDLIRFGAAPRLVGEALTRAVLEADPRESTDIGAALRLAAARRSLEPNTRIVLFSDGRPTVPGAEEAALALRRSGAELFAFALNLAAEERPPELRVESLALKAPSEQGAPLRLTAVVHASHAGEATATLVLDGVAREGRPVRLAAGRNEIDFEELRLEPGRYYAQALVLGDATPHDNVAGRELLVPGAPRVLCLAGAKRPSLVAEALATQGMQVEVAAAAAARDLEAYDVIVLLPDAPAEELERLAPALAEFVGRRGGGLLAVGGARGPGLARLHGTPTAFLLPVAVPPREEPEAEPPSPEPEARPRVEIVEEETEAYPITLCLIVDRSGSMQGDKIRRAKAAAAAAAAALTPQDRIAVITFGDEVEVAVPPQAAGDPLAVLRALEGLEARGQTRMFTALQQAFVLLAKERSPIRHAVLITDGKPTFEGHWRSLVQAAAERKITLSAVGIGWDIEAFFLARLARWGHGKYWSATHPHEIPQVVTQDTQRIVAARERRGEDAERSLPQEEEPQREPPPPEPEQPPEPQPPREEPRLRMMADPAAPREMLLGIADEELPQIAFPERGKLRFAAWAAVRAGDEGEALLAYRRVGLGTTAALLVDPEAEPELREHPRLPQLLAQLVRSILPDAGRDPVLLGSEITEDRLVVRLRGEDGLLRTDLPVEIGALEVRRRADRYEAALPPRAAPLPLTVRVVGTEVERTLVVPPSASPERAHLGADRGRLLRLVGDPAHLDPPPKEALDRPQERRPLERPLSLPFLLIAAILLPLDAWARRRIRSGSR